MASNVISTMGKLRILMRPHLAGKRVLLLFVVAMLNYMLMLNITIPYVQDFAGGMKVLDMRPTGYDFQQVDALFKSLGEEGRQAYLHYQIPADMLYPLLFALSYSLMMGYFLKQLKVLESRWFILCFLPLLGGGFDYLENFGVITLLMSYPDITPNMVVTTNIFTLTKSLFSTLFFLSLTVVLVVFCWRRLRSKPS